MPERREAARIAAAEPGVVVVGEVELVVGCESVDELAGVVVVGPVAVDGDVPGFVREEHTCEERVAGHAVDVDVDPDRGEVVLDDLGCLRAAALEDAVELCGAVAPPGEASCAGEVGDERVDVDVAVARKARRDPHLGGSRGGAEAAASRCERASVDGVAGRAAHALAREERTPGVEVEVVD